MSGITQILDSIFQNNGGTTRQWRTANEILLTQTSETKKYVSYMKNKIRDLNTEVQLLALDFLDYSIDDGKMPLWTQVGSKDFLQSLVNIYKTRNDEDVQEKILYLIKKWANKFQKYNTIIPNFTNIYNNLKDNDVSFPRDVESTYEKYLQGPGVQSGFGEPAQKETTQKTKSKNSNYVRDIDVDLRASSYEKKYKRLVNKLDDWTQQIQDANVYIDSAKDGNFDDDLRGICNELAIGKKQLVDTIESGKLKDERLMEISLNVQDDIELTLRRWNDLKNGRNPEPFKSSFFNKRDNDNNNRRQIDDTNDNSNSNNNNGQNKGGFDLLGFDDDFGGGNNNNNNNNANTGNDLLNVFSDQNQNSNQGNNNFFGNNNQNNNNNNFFGNNNQNTNNNNFFGNNNQNNTNQNNNFFGNNNNQNNANQNNNFFGNNNNQNNQNQNSNDLFSQMFNNNQSNANNNNNMNSNFMNNNNNNNNNSNNNFNFFQNNSNNAFNNNNQLNNNNQSNNNANTFGMMNSSNNNNFNFGNNNFNNFGFNNSNNNTNFSSNNNFDFNALNKSNNNNKNVSNKDFVFDF